MPRIVTRTLAFAATLPVLAALPIAVPSAAVARPAVEVAFVLDTTGSMGGLIEGAKRKIWSIATAIVDSNPDADIRMGLVAYRDIGDEYVTRKFELTTDIQDLYANLLELRARGGGDWPESVNEALDAAVNKMKWTDGNDVRRIVFLVGDAPPHMDYEQDTKYPVTLKVARQKDIVVNAVLAGNARETERVWRDIAQNGDGRFIPIPQDGGQVVVIETPYDEDIIILQREINGTVIPYGPHALQRRTEEKTKQLSQVAAAAPAQASEMASYLNKRARVSSEAVTGDGDLVADINAGRTSFSDIKDDDLPAHLRAMKPEQRMGEVNKQMTRRKALNEKLAALVARRDKYLADARAKAPPKASSFDRVVEDTLRAQIKR
ncbi:vWA domain-containing protein [Bradyrhizobium sp.]|uniref:vWA domain-containing protein n=1 Tax=Bradyrhizobium sp. TaxID=376 RepID=UPI0040384932